MKSTLQTMMNRRYKAVQLKILFRIAWKNLTHKKLRSLLTIFGVIIGIGAIYFLLSFGLGIQQLVTKQVIGDQSIKSVDVSSPNSRILQLDDAAVNKIKSYPHVEKVGVQFSFAGSLSLNNAEIDSVVYGIDQAYQELSSLNLSAGRLMTNEDTKTALLNRAALETLGVSNADEAIGKQISLAVPLSKVSEQTEELVESFTIVGIIDSGSGTEVFVPSHNFTSAGVRQYQGVKVVADHSDNIPDLRKQIESNGFQTASPIDTLEQINRVFDIFNIILIGFGSIGMIVAVLGMFNTLTISLLERTKEIGLMVALGGRKTDMRKLFVFEAVLISTIGALIGIGLAIAGGSVVNVIMNRFARDRGVAEAFSLFSTPLWLTGGLVLFMVLVGLAVVYIPARRAETINPIDALRRE